MESIFDYNPTEEELRSVIGGIKTKGEYDEVARTDQSRIIDLYCLFNLRGKDRKAKGYYNQIEDRELAYWLQYQDDF